MNAEKPSLAVALKTLWGASPMPFGEACAEPYCHPSFEDLTRRLQQLCDIGASGLLHGANGVGKSYLCGCFTEKLPEKRYKVLSLVHSSLTGNVVAAAHLGFFGRLFGLFWVLTRHTVFGKRGTYRGNSICSFPGRGLRPKSGRWTRGGLIRSCISWAIVYACFFCRVQSKRLPRLEWEPLFSAHLENGRR
jgi:hypothetical protein